jgi:uncharacterized membrane-anchored protein YjiN (DUF445 family)
VFDVVKALAEMLRAPELKALRRAFNMWIKGLLKRRTNDTKIIEKIDGIKDIFEGYDMAEIAYEYWDDIIEKKGELKGETKVLVRQLTRRFGPLPKWAEARVNKAKSAQLEKWLDAVLDASNLTEVLGAPGSSAKK